MNELLRRERLGRWFTYPIKLQKACIGFGLAGLTMIPGFPIVLAPGFISWGLSPLPIKTHIYNLIDDFKSFYLKKRYGI